MYVGIAWTTALINTSLPAFERSFSFQLANFLLSFSLKSLKVFLLFFPTKDSKPKYFSCYWITWTPNLFFILSLIWSGVFLLKNSVVFVRFNYWPEACSKTPKILCMALHSSSVALQKIILSSAKKRCNRQGAPIQTVIPSISPISIDFFIRVESPLAHNKNKYGDNGSPCHIPLDGMILPLGFPLIFTLG